MKRINVLLLLVFLTFTSIAFTDTISTEMIIVNGSEYNLNEHMKFENGLAYVGLRELYEHLGYEVSWNSEMHLIDVKNEGNHIRFRLSSDEATLNDVSKKISGPIIVENGVSKVPLNSVVDLLSIDIVLKEGMYVLMEEGFETTTESYDFDTLYSMALKESKGLRGAEENLERYEITSQEAYDDYILANSSSGTLLQNSESQRIGKEMAAKTIVVTKETLEHDLKKAMEGVIENTKKKVVVDKAAEISKVEFEHAKIKTDLGLLSTIDYKSAENDMNTSLTQATMQKTSLQSAYNTLNSLVGLDADTKVYMNYGTDFIQMIDRDLEKHISNVLKTSPTIWNLEQQIELAEIGVNYYVYNQVGDPYSVKKIDVTKAKIALEDARKSTEDFLRSTFNNITLLEETNNKLLLELDKAKNDLELARSNFDVGLTTKVVLDKATLNVTSIEQQILENSLDYKQLVRVYLKPWVASGSN